MIVEKVLNNNVVVSIEPKTRKEVILMGQGIAFGKKIGQEVDESKIEKTFIVEDKTLGDKIKKLINEIPEGVFELVDEIISYASKELDTELDKQIYISLSDHISFAIKRFKNNINIKNDLLNEIRRIYKKEFKVALWAVEYLSEQLEVKFPEDEAGFIALHFVNATYSETTTESITSTNIIKDILQIIRLNYKLEFNEDDLNYDRLLTHLKYFTKRIINNNKKCNTSDESFAKIIENSYSEAYKCSLKIKKYIENNYNYQVNKDEIIYLTIHIHRVVLAARDN
ncbi:MAG: PRD domain-containing protein [Clostridium sp.]|nr:PRD domain-containing protein [Clostridium sp.]